MVQHAERSRGLDVLLSVARSRRNWAMLGGEPTALRPAVGSGHLDAAPRPACLLSLELQEKTLPLPCAAQWTPGAGRHALC
jgi:hypothetical protein